MAPEFRPATAEDTGRICAIWHPGWHEGHAEIVPEELTSRRTLSSFTERLGPLLGKARVGLIDGEIAGFSVCLDDQLEQFYVAPEARGTGLAAAMLEDSEDAMARAGVTTAQLKCGIGNDRAAAFYRKNGWVQTGTVTAMLDTSKGPFALDVWLFEKSLG